MIYDLVAPIYDHVNEEIDYSKWADFIEDAVKRFGIPKTKLVLDLACGTGSMTIELAKRGYDMIGVDLSVEMLNVARARAYDEDISASILWLCQDMTEFELYGTVDLVVCCLDSINHLTSNKDLEKCFALVKNYLDPNGIFVFDINGRGKFERVYADKSYVVEDGDSFCVWQNFYNPKSKNCDFCITMFEENDDGTYTRSEEHQREHMYTISTIKKALNKTGLLFVGAYKNFELEEASDDNDRIYIIAKKEI